MIMDLINWISGIWDWYLTIGIVCALFHHIKLRIRCNKSYMHCKEYIVWKRHLPSLLLWVVAFPIKLILAIIDEATQ